jgi:phosphoribosylglycinamide formyltransferase-1
MRFGFYVSGQATRIQRALQAMKAQMPSLLAQMAFVFTDAPGNASLIERCRTHGVRLIEGDVSSIAKAERGRHVSDALQSVLSEHRVDYLFVFGQRLLSGPLLSAYRNRLINFHPSLLPAFPGLNAVDQAREAGAFLLGNSAHLIDEGVDTGAVLMQSISHASEHPDADSLMDLQVPMLLQLIQWIDKGRLEGTRIRGGSYAPGRFVPALELESLSGI